MAYGANYREWLFGETNIDEKRDLPAGFFMYIYSTCVHRQLSEFGTIRNMRGSESEVSTHTRVLFFFFFGKSRSTGVSSTD